MPYTAKTERQCVRCLKTIAVGEQYLMSDGDSFCLPCMEAYREAMSGGGQAGARSDGSSGGRVNRSPRSNKG